MGNTSTNMFGVDTIVLSSEWVTRDVRDEPEKEVYCRQKIAFKSKENKWDSAAEITTYCPSGIIIEDADSYQIDYVTDELGKKTMFIKKTPPELEPGQSVGGL
tara:strand:+ start:1492 stop:1800 length:309 start_codon:yes stop_codon:yes gene_type:complete